MIQESLETLPMKYMIAMAFQLHNLVAIDVFDEAEAALEVFTFFVWILNLQPRSFFSFIEHVHSFVCFLATLSSLLTDVVEGVQEAEECERNEYLAESCTNI